MDYAKELKTDFSIYQYEIYKQFRDEHYKDSSSLDFFISKYGEHGVEFFNKKIDKTGLNKEKLIEKHGIDKANEICKDKGITLSRMIKLYGEDGWMMGQKPINLTHDWELQNRQQSVEVDSRSLARQAV